MKFLTGLLIHFTGTMILVIAASWCFRLNLDFRTAFGIWVCLILLKLNFLGGSGSGDESR